MNRVKQKEKPTVCWLGSGSKENNINRVKQEEKIIKNRRMLRLWLLREICLFISGEISSDPFDYNVYFKKHRFFILSHDTACDNIFMFFWFFYDDYKDQSWNEIFDINDKENRRIIKVIGDMLVLLTSEFDFYKNRTSRLKRLKSIFRRQDTPPFYPFCSDWDRIAARKRFFLDKDDYVPKIIPQSVFNIYISSDMETNEAFEPPAEIAKKPSVDAQDEMGKMPDAETDCNAHLLSSTALRKSVGKATGES